MSDEDYPKIAGTLARNIKELRKSIGLSQEELAYQASVDRTFVSQIERATANPSLKTLWALTDVLGVPVVRLFSSNERKRQ